MSASSGAILACTSTRILRHQAEKTASLHRFRPRRWCSIGASDLSSDAKRWRAVGHLVSHAGGHSAVAIRISIKFCCRCVAETHPVSCVEIRSAKQVVLPWKSTTDASQTQIKPLMDSRFWVARVSPLGLDSRHPGRRPRKILPPSSTRPGVVMGDGAVGLSDSPRGMRNRQHG